MDPDPDRDDVVELPELLERPCLACGGHGGWDRTTGRNVGPLNRRWTRCPVCRGSGRLRWRIRRGGPG